MATLTVLLLENDIKGTVLLDVFPEAVLLKGDKEEARIQTRAVLEEMRKSEGGRREGGI